MGTSAPRYQRGIGRPSRECCRALMPSFYPAAIHRTGRVLTRLLFQGKETEVLFEHGPQVDYIPRVSFTDAPAWSECALHDITRDVMHTWQTYFLLLSGLLFTLPVSAGPPKRNILLLWHSPDGHPRQTHEYQLGQKILKYTLEKHAPINATLVCADDPWKEGPELLAKTDGVVLFVSEGAKWLQANPERLAAFQALAKRKGGLTVLHWAMGTKDARNIAAFVDLFGGCHGGPDRKYKVVQTDATIADKTHP